MRATDRFIDISEGPAFLQIKDAQLQILVEKEVVARVPAEEVAALVLSNPAVTMTAAVPRALAENNGILVVCDAAHTPCGMMLPLDSHSIQTERISVQIAAGKPLCKRLWQALIKAKITAQKNLLVKCADTHGGLPELVKQVRSGDPTNVEAQAARRYWGRLFGREFRRDPNASDRNRFLNYGYAILRAATARGLCACGLHPSIGLHHRNRYNSFCLADDVMEPFRPLVDAAVVEICQTHPEDAPLGKEIKRALIENIIARYNVDGESRTLSDILFRVAGSLAAVFEGRRKGLWLPELVPDRTTDGTSD